MLRNKIPALAAAALAGGLITLTVAHPHEVAHVKAAIQRVPVTDESNSGEFLGNYTVDQLRIVCGFGDANGWQVVTVASTGRMGYAPVSDANCAK